MESTFIFVLIAFFFSYSVLVSIVGSLVSLCLLYSSSIVESWQYSSASITSLKVTLKVFPESLHFVLKMNFIQLRLDILELSSSWNVPPLSHFWTLRSNYSQLIPQCLVWNNSSLQSESHWENLRTERSHPSYLCAQKLWKKTEK